MNFEKFKKYVFEINGQKFLNCTPHELKFDNGLTVEGSQELAQLLSAKPVEKAVETKDGITFVETVFETKDEGELLCFWAEQNGILLIGSIISAQAYKYPPVVSPIVTSETARLPPQQRIVFYNKFNVFPSKLKKIAITFKKT